MVAAEIPVLSVGTWYRNESFPFSEQGIFPGSARLEGNLVVGGAIAFFCAVVSGAFGLEVWVIAGFRSDGW